MPVPAATAITSTDAGAPPTRHEATRGEMVRATLVGLALDAGTAVAAYGLVRLAGGSVTLALLAGAVVALARAGWVMARRREVDPFAVFMVGVFVVGFLLTLWSGSERFLLVKESFGTGAAGLAFVVTCLRGKPLAYYASQRVAAPTDAERSEWSGFWATEPVFRRRFRVMSLVIGGALLADAAVRVAAVFLLPADVVAVLSAIGTPVVLAAVSTWAIHYGLGTEAAVARSHQP